MINKYKISILITLIAFFFLSSPAHSSENKKSLSINLIDNIPPYSYREDNTERGVDIQIIKEIFSRLHIDISLDLLPWARLILRAEEGAIDAIGAKFCDGREEWKSFLNYSNPIYSSNISIFSQTSSEQQPVNSLKELEGTSIGKVRDYFYRSEFEHTDFFDFYEFQDDELLLRSLVMGRIDYALTEELPFMYFCSLNQSCELIQKSMTFDKNAICLAFVIQENEDETQKLVDDVNAVIAELQAEGFIDTMLNKYQY